MTAQTDEPVHRRRRIHLAHRDAQSRRVLTAMLQSLNHEVPVVTDSGHEFIERSLNSGPDLLVCSPKLSDMDGIEALIRIGNKRPTPSIVIAHAADLEQVERAMEDDVMAYLVEPITADMLVPAIYLAERRFRHFQELRGTIEQLENRLQRGKLVERAKGVVMNSRGLSEAEAHKFLQDASRQTRKKLTEVARLIVETEDILGMLPEGKEFPDDG